MHGFWFLSLLCGYVYLCWSAQAPLYGLWSKQSKDIKGSILTHLIQTLTSDHLNCTTVDMGCLGGFLRCAYIILGIYIILRIYIHIYTDESNFHLWHWVPLLQAATLSSLLQHTCLILRPQVKKKMQHKHKCFLTSVSVLLSIPLCRRFFYAFWPTFMSR